MSELFGLSAKIDAFDITYYKSLPEEERKKLYLFTVMRFMSGTSDAKQIQYLNSFVNTKVFSMYYHPDLVYKLLCSSSTGSKRYTYMHRKKKEKDTLTLEIIKTYYKCDSRDAKEYAKILTPEDILEMAEAIGIEKESVIKLKKELK